MATEVHSLLSKDHTIKIQHCYIQAEVLVEYNLTLDYFDSKRYGCFEVQKVMFEHIEAAILASEQLQEHMAYMVICL